MVKPKPDERPYLPGDPIPAPDAVEKNTETTWQLFQELSDKADRPYADTVPLTVPGGSQPLPSPGARAAGASLVEKLFAESTRKNRVCPVPEKWLAFHHELASRGPGDELGSLAPPLTGRSWKDTSSLAKRMSFKDHIAWAASHGLADTAYRFLSQLAETDWHHMGDPVA